MTLRPAEFIRRCTFPMNSTPARLQPSLSDARRPRYLFQRQGKHPVLVQSRSARVTRAKAAPSISPGWPSALATLRSISKMSRF